MARAQRRSGWTDPAHRRTTEEAAAERGGMADGGGTSDPMAAVSAPPPRSWSSFPLLRSPPPRRRRSKRPIRGGGRTRMHLFPFPWTEMATLTRAFPPVSDVQGSEEPRTRREPMPIRPRSLASKVTSTFLSLQAIGEMDFSQKQLIFLFK